ncbi:hypothetical protein GCM10010038_35690 [Glutamicibacter protophormiae]|nr:hypothetical protein GCM10010038_35690 [Glutamicibacter protophormiae]
MGTVRPLSLFQVYDNHIDVRCAPLEGGEDAGFEVMEWCFEIPCQKVARAAWN